LNTRKGITPSATWFMLVDNKQIAKLAAKAWYSVEGFRICRKTLADQSAQNWYV
jgi:hypothetical protein